MRSLPLVALIVALVAGCGGGSKPAPVTPAPAAAGSTEPASETATVPTEPTATGTLTDAELETLGTGAVVLIESLAVTIETHAKDCGAMAIGLEKVVADHRGFMDGAKQWKGNQAVEARLEIWMKQNGVMDRVMPKMMPGMMACSSDPGVEAALKKFDN